MKVIIVDDDNLVAISLKTIVESDSDIEVIATGTSGEEAISLYETMKPDVLLMDIRMGEVSGLTAGEKILQQFPDAKILFLTTFSDDEYIVKALAMGAKGYIIKQDFDGIVPALKTVYGGQTVFGNDVASKFAQIFSVENETNQTRKEEQLTGHGLTPQEIEVAHCVAKGLSNKEIATALFLSEGTVRNYLSSVLDKLGLRDRTNLAIFMLKD